MSEVADYHSLDRDDLSGDATYKIGVEIEKEDAYGYNICEWEPLYDETGWCKEEDGSLDSWIGFELISPTYDLFSDRLIETVRANHALTVMVNSKYSQACGGHIHVSQQPYSGYQLFDRVCGYLPMLYAMFPKRATRGYSLAKKFTDLRNTTYKEQAVRIMRNRIEMRIFPAVADVDDLEWRIKLMRIIMTNPAQEPATVVFNMLDTAHPLCALLIDKYKEDYVLSLAADTLKWMHKLEGISLNIRVGFNANPNGINPRQLSIV